MTDVSSSAARLWRVRLAGLLPFALFPFAFFGIARALAAWTSPSGEAEGDADEKLSICRHADLDQGAAQRTDLAAVRRAYATLKKDLEKTLAGQKAKAMAVLDLAHDAGLPRCGFGGSKRSATLPEALPVQFRSRTFYFLRLDGGFEDVPWEDEIAKDPRAEVLVLAAKRPADAGDLSKRLKRPVTFATADLAKALGVTCGPTKVSVGENGRDLVIQEGR